MYLKLVSFGNALGCHQRTERSFFYKNFQFPICARCTGLYLGNFIGLFLFFENTPMLILGFAVTFIDGAVQMATSYESNNIRRFITGLISGIAMLSLIKQIFLYIF